jgi:hypothetical protein
MENLKSMKGRVFQFRKIDAFAHLRSQIAAKSCIEVIEATIIQ